MSIAFLSAFLLKAATPCPFLVFTQNDYRWTLGLIYNINILYRLYVKSRNGQTFINTVSEIHLNFYSTAVTKPVHGDDPSSCSPLNSQVGTIMVSS